MDPHSNSNNTNVNGITLQPMTNTINALKKVEDIKHFLGQYQLPDLLKIFDKLTMPSSKKSFLVFKQNKYVNVLTKNIALFYISYESSVIMCFDKQEYIINHSLEQIQNSLSEKQFFRLNRQCLINFNAIKEVEHYFARKLLVNPIVPVKEKLIVSKEKVTSFLQWLDNR